MARPFLRGNANAIRQYFRAVDVLTQVETLVDPELVVFTVVAPDDTETVYTFGVDSNVTNPDVGVYICALDPELPVGVYRWSAEGTTESSDPPYHARFEDWFPVIESSIEPADPPPAPVMGPCSQWINGQDVASCARVDYGDDTAYVFDQVAYTASLALYEISQRQFPGLCERKVRPCRDNCGCGGSISSGMGPWFWTTAPWGAGGAWGWYTESGDRFGCKPMSRVRLAGYPVSQILEVLIGGEEIPEFDPDTGARNWRLDKWRYLVRMDEPGVGGGTSTPRFWPSCQNMSLDDDQPGTFSIRYRWGTDVPQLGRDAAVELANQFFLACGGQNCVLPAGVQRVVRQGIEVERGLLANFLDPTKPTGLVQLDAFLAAYCRGQRGGRKSAVWSPDVQAFARRVGVNE